MEIRNNAIIGSPLSPIVTKTTNYTVTINDYTILCNASGGAFTITLPPAISFFGDSLADSSGILVIKKIDATLNVITIDGNGTETIDGDLTKLLGSQYHSVTIQSTGSGWIII